jgi:serine/threonine protein kinase/predicted ATPase
MGTTLAPERLRPDQLPVQFGRYTLTGILGEGGMARVFQATLVGPGGFTKQVAIKVIRTQDERVAEEHSRRFSIEARLGGLLRHPSIVDIYDFGEVEQRHYIAMELIDGVTIREMVRQLGALPASVLLDITSQVCDGLIHAHSLLIDGEEGGLVHRDLTPGNIMVTHMGVAKVMDFGLAHARDWGNLTDTGESLLGTPAYMSPEHIRHVATVPASDLFSLGAVIYSMATGRKLFGGPTPYASLMKIETVEETLRSDAFRTQIDRAVPGLSSVLHRCLRHDVAERYPSAEPLRADIEALRASAPTTPTLRRFIEKEVLGGETGLFDRDANSSGADKEMSVGSHTDRSRTHTLHHTIAPRTNVGQEQAGFIGRVTDLADLHDDVEAGHQLVTIVGPGGSGKTRLAQRFVKELLEKREPRWSVWWCDLSTARTLQGIVQSVAAALDVKVSALPTTAEQVARLGEAMAQADHILIVLDNFEQVVDLAGASVSQWLQSAPVARFIVTSQVRLHITGEVCKRLSPLDESEAKELFLERAIGAGGDSALLNQDQDALFELMRRLDHLPLAIELAAARAAVLSPAQILDRLSARFQLLRSTHPDGPQRQASLEQALDWSWELLEPWEQACLAQLSAFSGGFRMEDVEHVVDLGDFPEAPWIVFVVEALVDRSLVHATTTHGGQVRLGMSGAVQEYAEAQLGANQDAVWQRHGRWYAQYGTVKHIRGLRLEGGQGRLNVLIQNRANLSAAIDRGIANGWTDIASQVGHALAVVLGYFGPPDAIHTLRGQLLDLPGLSPEQRCRTLLNLSWHKLSTDLDGAVQDFEEAHALAREIGNPSIEEVCLSNLGAVYMRTGDLDAAQSALEACAALSKKYGIESAGGSALVNLGNVHERRGHHDAAIDAYVQALDLSMAIGDRIAMFHATTNLGDVYRTVGQPERAREHLDRGLELIGSLGSPSRHVILLMNCAALDLDEGAPDAAASRIDEARAIAEPYGEQRLIGGVLGLEAKIQLQRGDLDEARALVQQAEDALSAAANEDWLMWTLCTRADVELASGKLDAAEATLLRIEALQVRVGVASNSSLGKDIDRLRATMADATQR